MFRKLNNKTEYVKKDLTITLNMFRKLNINTEYV